MAFGECLNSTERSLKRSAVERERRSRWKEYGKRATPSVCCSISLWNDAWNFDGSSLPDAAFKLRQSFFSRRFSRYKRMQKRHGFFVLANDSSLSLSLSYIIASNGEMIVISSSSTLVEIGNFGNERLPRKLDSLPDARERESVIRSIYTRLQRI